MQRWCAHKGVCGGQRTDLEVRSSCRGRRCLNLKLTGEAEQQLHMSRASRMSWHAQCLNTCRSALTILFHRNSSGSGAENISFSPWIVGEGAVQLWNDAPTSPSWRKHSLEFTFRRPAGFSALNVNIWAKPGAPHILTTSSSKATWLRPSAVAPQLLPAEAKPAAAPAPLPPCDLVLDDRRWLVALRAGRHLRPSAILSPLR